MKNSEELRKMTDKEFLDYVEANKYASKWNDKEALHYAMLRIAGNKYMKTGNINSFKKVRRYGYKPS